MTTKSTKSFVQFILYYIVSFLNWCFARSSTTTDKARELLNEWKIKMYAENRFLYDIPWERQQLEYGRILKTLENES